MNRKWFRYFLLLPALLVILIGVSAASNLFFPTSSEDASTLSSAEKARIAEAIHLRDSLGDGIWPGFGEAAIPIIVYNEAYAFLLNYQGEPPAGWVLPRSGQQQGSAWVQVSGDDFYGGSYYRQALTDDATPQAFTVRLGEQWAASMNTYEWSRIKLAQLMREDLPSWLDPVVPFSLVTRLFIGNTDKYVSVLTHESFHAFVGLQSERHLIHAENVARREEDHYPWGNEANIAGWQEELDLLTAALRASDSQEAAELARQFLAARDERRSASRLAARLVEYEQQREWLEGLAKYVELESWRRGATTAGYAPHATTAELADFDGYAGFERAWEREVDQIARMVEDQGDGRFYYSGMAQAALLDRLLPSWKDGALTGGTTLEGLLDAAVNDEPVRLSEILTTTE
jgi:hypothetical protein